MRGEIVALGVILVIFGGSLVVVPTLFSESLFYLEYGIRNAVFCILPIILVVIGFMIFVAGLIGKSKAELEAMRPYYPPPPQP